MKRKLLISGLVLASLALLVGMGISTYQSVSAATPAPSDATSSGTSSTVTDTKGPGSRGEANNDEYLAQALGITTDELSAARQAAYEKGLAQAVEQGLMTQAQVDELKSDDSSLPYSRRWGGWLTENGIDFDSLLAEELGISVDQLEEARLTAQNARIDQAVTDGKMTEEQALLMKARYALTNSQKFQNTMQSAYQTAIQQAVDDGLITQEQADLLLQETLQFGMHGMGGPGMGGGHGHHGGGMPPADTSDQSESNVTP